MPINDLTNFESIQRSDVAGLCELAASPDAEISGEAVRLLFAGLIERLNDSFEPESCEIYDRVFSQVIDFFRRTPEGKRLDEGLKSFGLLSEADLLARKSGLSTIDYRPPASLKKVILLSRVTIGADVAITSVIINKLRRSFPDAEIVILGSGKLRELYGGDPLIRIHEISYQRGGAVISRLLSWLDVVKAVEEETSGLSSKDFLLIDPDSRLTQLGLLPLLKDERNYLFFESRSYQKGGGSLGRLASTWLGEITGDETQAFPFVSLPESLLKFGRKVCSMLRKSNDRPIIAISYGVGGNQAKRISDEFELKLVEELLKNSTVILDKGASEEERRQVDRIVEAAGKKVIELDEKNASSPPQDMDADILTWDGGIGAFASLIAGSDQYIGYDSAAQHIAAAIGTPTLTYFFNLTSERFAERWRPYGRGKIEALSVK